MTGSAIEAMRALTLRLDSSVEALLDAHGFVLSEMRASAAGAEAAFHGTATAEAWQLTIAQTVDGALVTTLCEGRTPPPSLTLHIQAGPGAGRSLAEAVGLGLSLVAFADQMRRAA